MSKPDKCPLCDETEGARYFIRLKGFKIAVCKFCYHERTDKAERTQRNNL